MIPMAEGRVLELGIGSGNTLLHYNGDRVSHLTAIDPSRKLWERRKLEISTLDFGMEYIEGVADQIPFEEATFDAVVTTYTLCSVGDIEKSLSIHNTT